MLAFSLPGACATSPNSSCAEGLIDPDHFHGTINCNAVNAKGDIAGVTTTSGLAWKIPGRIGDSPILGAGLYVDGEIGGGFHRARRGESVFAATRFLRFLEDS